MINQSNTKLNYNHVCKSIVETCISDSYYCIWVCCCCLLDPAVGWCWASFIIISSL